MMATKERNFSPLKDLSLEELVSKDNFYRRLEEKLDLSFVRELVGDRYASVGRPSVDPVVFFKLQLVLFFEDLRSERRLMAVAADRLSIRWYLGYRSWRTFARSLKLNLHPPALRARSFPLLLRGDRRVVHRSGVGVG